MELSSSRTEAKPASPAPIAADQVVRALGALAQTQRLAAFRRLIAAGPGGLSAGALAAAADAPASSMSFHLAQLAHAGLVVRRRVSRSILYSADYAAMSAVLAYLTENCCAGAPCSLGPAETAAAAPAAALRSMP